MVKAVDFAVRSSAGGIVRGGVAGDGGSTFLQVGSGEAVSLNLAPGQVTGYERQGPNLIVRLVDGREIVLSGYFDHAPGQENRLYLSSQGETAEVYLTDSGNGIVYASYGPAEGWSKFSALDDLRFDSGDTMAVAQGSGNDTAGMGAFIPAALAGLGGKGALGAAALVGGAAIVGGGSGGGGGGGGGNGPGRVKPTVDNPDASNTLTTNTNNPTMTVTGTGEPGDTVKVDIGNVTGTTTIKPDGTWAVTFPPTNLPVDGTHPAVVTVTPPGLPQIPLNGPTFIVDMTPPAVDLTEGTGSTGHIENLEDYQDGVTIGGTGEPGASIQVEVSGATQTTTVKTDGTWTVTFTQSQVAGGEYTVPVKVTATDPLGNQTVITDTLVVDTVPHPLAINPVTIAGQTQTATAGSNGTWSISYPAGQLTPGEYDATITARTVDGAGNVSSTTHTMRVDTVTSVTLNAPIAGDNIVNATESAAGVALSGTAQAGSTVMVGWGGTTLPATVAANGAWTVTFPAGTIPGGEYNSTVNVTATDAAGNTATTSREVRIDTQTTVSVNPGQAGGDDILSGAEQQGGLALTGRAEPGATVAVTFEGTTRTVTANATGNWQATWSRAEVPTGTYNSTVSVTATDTAGNTATTSHALRIDTEVTDFRRLTLSTGADDVLNAAEAAQGLTVTGTVEPGSTVMVRFGQSGVYPATVAANGAWTVTIPANQIPAGENSVTLTATATDKVGNVATHTEQVTVDTIVTPFARTGGPIGGDGILNATEVAAGLPIGGTAEPGATVVVRLSNGATQSVVSDASGKWSVTFSAANLPRGELDVTATITATDRAGNTATATETFHVDTVAPGSPEVLSFSRDANGLRAIGTEATTDAYSFFRIDAAGNQNQVAATRSDDLQFNETNFRFGATVPDGSYLVINTADVAGNQSSTLLVVDNTNAPTVNLARGGLSNFDFSAIDLTFAPDANLRITEAQLRDLTGPDNRLLVKGGADDTVTLVDATATGQTTVIDGQRYSIFTLGDAGATVLLDDDIRAVI